ncbi:hypothetical protein PG994_012007 [Apiospora phragmitis]|uniref:DUF155 domain-containing protein n=1 Tax=Apiospora phragmitis TaxID=2905665 RepID=A0ABR1TUM3_9PEZI
MRPSIHQVGRAVTRGLHTAISTPRPTRCFHQSSVLSLPRRRNFFTSNNLLAANGEKGDVSALEAVGDEATEDPATPRAPATGTAAATIKPRPTRPVASKKRRSAAVKTQIQKAAAKKDNLTWGGSEVPEVNYENQILAICVAQSFDMEKVEEILTLHNYDLDPDAAGLNTTTVIHARAAKGDIFVFDSGTVVAWSVPSSVVMKIATKQLFSAAEVPHVKRAEMEELEFTTDEARDTSYMRGEEVVLGTKTGNTEGNGSSADVTWAKVAFSSGLARSPKLAVLENQMEEFNENARPIAITLKGGSEMNQPRPFILKKTGELLSLRSQLNEYELAESLPDLFWDKESKLEQYYDRVGKALDVEPRIAQLNKRIDYANELVAVMREMSSEKQGHRLEWIIIILITVEVGFELRRVYMEEFGNGRPIRENLRSSS